MEAYSQVKFNEKWTTYDDVTVKYRTGGLEVFGNMMINNGNHSEDNTIATDTRANGNHVNIIQVCPNNFWYTMLGGQIGASYDFNDDKAARSMRVERFRHSRPSHETTPSKEWLTNLLK